MIAALSRREHPGNGFARRTTIGSRAFLLDEPVAFESGRGVHTAFPAVKFAMT
jgi:hypothetical protein